MNENAKVILERVILVAVSSRKSAMASRYDLSGNRTHITFSLCTDIKAEYNIIDDLAGSGWQTQYRSDLFGLESERTFEDAQTEHRNPDKAGNLFEGYYLIFYPKTNSDEVICLDKYF